MFILLSITLSIKVSDKRRSTMTRQVTRDRFVTPEFISKQTFLKKLQENSNVQKSYFELKKANDYKVIQYSFKISKSGMVISSASSSDRLMTEFLKKNFDNLKWTPAHDKYDQKNKLVSYCVLTIMLLPMEKTIAIDINAGNGDLKYKPKVISHDRIKMDELKCTEGYQ